MAISRQSSPKNEEFCSQCVFKSDTVTRPVLRKALFQAYLEARIGKRGTEDEIRFEVNLFDNIDRLTEAIITRTYKPGRGIAFIVRDPVIREIFAATFKDRVVHHLLYDLSYNWWDRRFIGNSFSCRVGKGTELGWRTMRKDMIKCSKMGKVPSTIYKFDLSGYFMSLNRRLLYERVDWGLKQQFKEAPKIYQLAKYLWHEVIFDHPTEGVTIRGTKHDWRNLPKTKSLFFQPPETGIVIGNLTSQLLSNIYLDQLDRFVKIELGYKYYGRYVDDFYIVIPNTEKARLAKDRKRIELYLGSLGLKLHPKKCYAQPVEHGVEFLGAKVYLQHVQPGSRVKHNFHRAVYNTANGLRPNFEAITSYTGLMTRMKADKEIARIFEKVGWEYEELSL
ncbi:RNA-directed DNA polymerase [Candidatus Saccharibacteria bacterium]|nr:RNA-directed DNA polymerase [Candidatus Saccharibacteria bacterium]